jgi:hypothetical protein
VYHLREAIQGDKEAVAMPEPASRKPEEFLKMSETDVLREALHGRLSKREMSIIGLSKDTQRAVLRLIELSPALEEAILNIVDLCYRDGAFSVAAQNMGNTR